MTSERGDAPLGTAAQHTVAEHLRLTAAGRMDEWVRLSSRTRCSSSPCGFPETFDVEFVGLPPGAAGHHHLEKVTITCRPWPHPVNRTGPLVMVARCETFP